MMSWKSQIRAVLRRLAGRVPISSTYEVLARRPALDRSEAWIDPAVATRQHQAFLPVLAEMRKGNSRGDFTALASAISATKATNPHILELGCGTGWNNEVIKTLYQRPFRYTGLDCSSTMIQIAREAHKEATFVVGDATATPFPDGSCDILVSGTVLMHLINYEQAVAESRRLAAAWCIFHTVPYVLDRPTTFLRKLAYGKPTIEIVFNEDELIRLFSASGLQLEQTFESLPYNLKAVLGVETSTRTYLCKVSP